MPDEPVTEARDALLVIVARLEGKFDTGMAELRSGVAAITKEFADHVRRTEDKQREIELKVDTLWDRYNLQRGIGVAITLILGALSVYAALRASGVHF